MTKGEASTDVTQALPDTYAPRCRPCATHHVGEQLMRLAALPGGLRLVSGASPAVLTPIEGRPEVVATWRPKASGRRLTITVATLDRPLTDAVRRQVDAEAEHVAAARGSADVTVVHAKG
jgi:hypothetical protein